MIRLAIRRPVAVSMGYFAVALLGVAAWRNLPIEFLPDTQLPRLIVNATWPGASPETMEAFVTAPLESVIQQVRGVENVSSESFEQNGIGNARITVEFARDTDMNFARLELSERINSIREELPINARTNIQPYVPREFQEQTRPFMRYTVTGPYTLEALRAHVDEVIIPELLQLDGVGAVTAYGGRERVLELELDEDRITALGLNPFIVAQRIRDLEYVTEAGTVEEGGLLRTLTIRQRTDSIGDVLQTPLLVDRGRVVRVRDVARVHDTFEDATSYYRINGNPAVSFFISRQANTNAVAVADRVKAHIEKIEPLHPPGVRLILQDDESRSIRQQLSDLRFRALISAGVIFVVLLLFLNTIGSSAIVFSTIALSILLTLNLIYFAGFSLNVLTLMGIAMGFGLIVDNAIVVLENIYRRHSRGESPAYAAEHGARDVVIPILAATLTTVVVLVPFVYLQGELQIYYMPLAVVVGLSLVASLFVAFTFIPALASRVLKNRAATEAPALAVATASGAGSPTGAASAADSPAGAASAGARSDWYAGFGRRPPIYVRFYATLIRATLRFPWLTVIVALAMLGGSYYLFDKYVTRGVIWSGWGGTDTYISIQITLPRGEELERTDELTRFFEERLKAMPEIEEFVTNVTPQAAFIRVTFPKEIENTAIPVAIKEQLVAFSHGFGGAEVRVYGYGPSFYGGGSSPPNYSIRVFGYNYETVREIAEDLGRRLRRFSRIRDVDTNASGAFYQRDRATEIVLRINRERLAMHDLTVQDVVRQVSSAVRGQTQAQSSRIRVGGEELHFAVKLAGHREMDLLALQELLIPAPGGKSVRLGDVADLEERQVLARILRRNQQYERRVSYEFRGPARLGDQVQKAVVEATALPAGYKLETRMDWRWDTEEQRQIYGVLAVSILLIYMVTAALFESLRQPLCVLFAVPMALIGVFLLFFYTGATFTREAYIGVIMMGGVVVNNSILLVDHINQLRRRDGLALDVAVVRGTLERVRPIMMTSSTTVLGLLPLVLFSSSADANIWNALSYALIGGLTSSTILVLLVAPALYYIFERRRARATAPTAAPTPAPAPTA